MSAELTGADLVAAMCAMGRDAVRAGLVVASGGNLSARAPGGKTCWVTGAGRWLDRLTPEDFVEVRLSDGLAAQRGTAGEFEIRGTRIENGPAQRGTAGEFEKAVTPSTELALHLATYRVRPDVNAVVHLHPQLAILLDSVGEPIRLITTDHAFYLRRIARTPFHPPNTAELAEVAADAVADGTNCVILAHHGCSVMGADLAMAYRRALNLEEAARLTYRALVLTGGLPGRIVVECPWVLPDAGTI